MEEASRCRRGVLAANVAFRIERCDCGAIHLIMGFATKRIDQFAFSELARAAAEAMWKLERPRQMH